jgi:hypothetical protein
LETNLYICIYHYIGEGDQVKRKSVCFDFWGCGYLLKLKMFCASMCVRFRLCLDACILSDLGLL